jgi:hypothetical protein
MEISCARLCVTFPEKSEVGTKTDVRNTKTDVRNTKTDVRDTKTDVRNTNG